MKTVSVYLGIDAGTSKEFEVEDNASIDEILEIAHDKISLHEVEASDFNGFEEITDEDGKVLHHYDPLQPEDADQQDLLRRILPIIRSEIECYTDSRGIPVLLKGRHIENLYKNIESKLNSELKGKESHEKVNQA